MMRSGYIKIFLYIVCIGLLLFALSSCSDDHIEYEVTKVNKYFVLVSSDEDRPQKDTRLVFVYQKNGRPAIVRSFANLPEHRMHIIIGDTNKYVITRESGWMHQYLSLTQETYDEMFLAK